MGEWPIVAGTGHRKLADDGDRRWARENITRGAVWLAEHGTQVGVSGLASGFDQDWAEAVLAAGMQLWAFVPFEGQDAKWTRAQRERWGKLRAAAHRVEVVGVLPPNIPPERRSGRVNQLLHGRNTAMLRASRAVFALWQAGNLTGGTHSALEAAASRGMPGVWLDPAARTVKFELPTLDQLARLALFHARCRCIDWVGLKADVERRRDDLALSGYREWLVRPARSWERRGDGCPTCRPAAAGR